MATYLIEELKDILFNLDDDELLRINNEIFIDEDDKIYRMSDLNDLMGNYEIGDLIALGYGGFNPYDNYFKKWFDDSLNTYEKLSDAVNFEWLANEIIDEENDHGNKEIREFLNR